MPRNVRKLRKNAKFSSLDNALSGQSFKRAMKVVVLTEKCQESLARGI